MSQEDCLKEQNDDPQDTYGGRSEQNCAQTCSGQMDDRLTACKKGQLFALPRVGAGYGTKELPASRASQQSLSVKITGS